MEKISYSLGQVANLRMTLNVFTKEDAQVVRGKVIEKAVVTKKLLSPDGNNVSTDIRLGYFVAFSIWNGWTEGMAYDKGNSFAFGPRNLFQFKVILKDFLKGFNKEGLFKMAEINGVKRLIVNKEMSQKMRVMERIGNVTICLMFTVVNVTKDYIDGVEDLYEGFVLYVNDVQHYIQFTMDDGLYLCDILDKSNFSLMALELYKMSLMLKSEEGELVPEEEVKEENPFFNEIRDTSETNPKQNGIANENLLRVENVIPDFGKEGVQ